jgi:hypothetical protein
MTNENIKLIKDYFEELIRLIEKHNENATYMIDKIDVDQVRTLGKDAFVNLVFRNIDKEPF